MSPRPKTGSAFRFPRRTLRVRLALLYGAAFFASSAVLLAIPNLFAGTKVHARSPGEQSAAAPVTTQHVADVHRFLTASLVGLAVMFVVSIALGWLLSGRALRPLRTITSTAQHISSRNLDQRLALAGRDDELKQLGATLDQLFERLQASFESQRHFVANASHELRSPLAGQRTIIEVALADPEAGTDTLRSACEAILTLGEQQEHLIEALLALATSERGIEQWQTVDLAEITRTVLSGHGQEAKRRGIHIETTIGTATMAGDPKLVESLVTNLIDNALRHNMAGGHIEISTTTTDRQARIAIRNTGPAIPSDQVERLFRPFQQLGNPCTHTGGHGLGLAIVDAIADAHGAELAAHNRAEGGLDIEVTFPETPPPGSKERLWPPSMPVPGRQSGRVTGIQLQRLPRTGRGDSSVSQLSGLVLLGHAATSSKEAPLITAPDRAPPGLPCRDGPQPVTTTFRTP
jgi:signal transduction histidine kinase